MPSLSSIFSSSALWENRAVLRRVGVTLAGWLCGATAIVFCVNLLFGAVPITLFDQRFFDLRERQDELEVLVLGSSQMMQGVDPSLLGVPALNVAAGSQDIYYDSQILKAFAPDMPKLKTVIWGLELWRPRYDLGEAPKENRLQKLYDPYFARRSAGPGPSPFWSHFHFLRVRGSNPFATATDLFGELFGNSLRKHAPNHDGYTPSWKKRRPTGREFDDAPSRGDYHSNIGHRKWYWPNLDEMVATTEILQKRGVRVVFVTPPTSTAYRQALHPEVKHAFSEYVADLQRRTGAEFFDMSDALGDKKVYFENADHLLDQGTKAFSEILASRVLRAPQ